MSSLGNTEENATTLLENEHVLSLIVCGGEGLPLKDVLELAYASKRIYEVVGKNNRVWKHFSERYKLEITDEPTMTSFFNVYKSQL